MNEERLNPYFDINAKYEDMILRGKSIVEHYLSVSDGDGEAPDYICLAYDVKNYLPKLQQENQQLKDRINIYEDPDDLTLMFMYCDEQAKDKIKQLKDRIDKAIKYIEHYTEYYKVDGKDYLKAMRNYGLEEYQIPELLEILKGEK